MHIENVISSYIDIYLYLFFHIYFFKLQKMSAVKNGEAMTASDLGTEHESPSSLLAKPSRLKTKESLQLFW